MSKRKLTLSALTFTTLLSASLLSMASSNVLTLVVKNNTPYTINNIQWENFSNSKLISAPSTIPSNSQANIKISLESGNAISGNLQLNNTLGKTQFPSTIRISDPVKTYQGTSSFTMNNSVDQLKSHSVWDENNPNNFMFVQKEKALIYKK